MAVPEGYVEKVYAGLLGKCIGIRLGAPVEATVWTYERIRRTYGEITGYLRAFRNFAADDDFNGPVFFIRALRDSGTDRELAARDVGRAWLNYARDGRGFFWWGGYGRSTEHTAYMNLAAGIGAPESGSARRNGLAAAEQIGGQIFVDTWGLVFPGNPELAARYGGMAASVSHDGNGIYGGMFVAAAVSAAFGMRDPRAIVEAALRTIPGESEYARVVQAVLAFHQAKPGDWRACRDMLDRDFGYDRYPGACHIIPNAGVCILALLYGGGSLSRTVEIATMCAWDTDCNAGTTGAVIGVAGGLSGVEAGYRDPINDFHACSSAAGPLNIVDLPTLARELALEGCRMAGEEVPAGLAPWLERGDLRFDFDLPGSTHGFRSSSNAVTLRHSPHPDGGSGGVLEILVDRLAGGASAKVYHKTFYRREDFDDERYAPAFSPTAYAGQRMSCRVKVDAWDGRGLGLIPYARAASDRREIEGAPLIPKPGVWQDVRFTLPEADGSVLDEVGLRLAVFGEDRVLAKVWVDDFLVTGPAEYGIRWDRQAAELSTVTPGVANRGSWSVAGDRLEAMSAGPAEFTTGRYYAADYEVSTSVIPYAGVGHGVAFRAGGAAMGYAAVLGEPGRAALYRNDGTLARLASADFPWEYGREYAFVVRAVGDRLQVSIGGRAVFDVVDGTCRSGMVGYLRSGPGRCSYGGLRVRELG